MPRLKVQNKGIYVFCRQTQQNLCDALKIFRFMTSTKGEKVAIMVDNMNKNEKLIKFALWGSVALDIFMYVCFLVGFAAGIGGAQIGFLMIGIVFRYGRIIAITSIALKLIVIIFSFARDTNSKQGAFSVALSSLLLLLIIGGVMWGIYYIGKVMSTVG